MSDAFTPIRIQRLRAAGWRQPRNTVYVGRPTPWGNRAVIIGPDISFRWWVQADGPTDYEPIGPFRSRDAAHWEAVDIFRARLQCDIALAEQAKLALRGKNLACWCRLDRACHADVLLEIANG